MITQKQINARDEYIRYCDLPKQSGYIYMMRQIIKKIIAEADKEAAEMEARND